MAGGKQGGGGGAPGPPRGREHSGDKRAAARNYPGDLNSEQGPRPGTVSFYPSPVLPSLLGFPQKERNHEIRLGLPWDQARSPAREAGTLHCQTRPPAGAGGGRTGSRNSLLDLYFNFRKELRKHALESQEGEKS